MPHFIIHCSNTISSRISKSNLLQNVHDSAVQSGLFNPSDIKVRILPFEDYLVGGKQAVFLHVFGFIMEGRSTKQKANLTKLITSNLNEVLPKIAVLSMNIEDFEKDTYTNKHLL